MRIRDARSDEAPALEALQRRSSDVWDAYREQLADHPDAIELPQAFVDNGWVRVAAAADDTAIGFSVVFPAGGPAHELDGLFVEPEHMHRGVGRALVEDAATRAARAGAECLEVTAGPAEGFYEKAGFDLVGSAQTRFGPAVRLRRMLRSSPLVDHVGVLVHVELMNEAQWGASAQLFAEGRDGQRLLAQTISLGAGGQTLAAYQVPRAEIESAINRLLGRDPEPHRPSRPAWDPLIDALQTHGIVLSVQELIAMPFVFEFSADSDAIFEPR